MKYHIFSLQEVKHLLPEDSVYLTHYRAKYNPQVIVVQGDWYCAEPLDLDEPEKVFTDFDWRNSDEEHPFFILVQGDMTATNIYNAETDGSCGLVVLGNLTAQNIVVGGQEIYVAKDLTVSDLFWGDYNHGNLVVAGQINIRVFLETDYGYDYGRFQAKDRINIDYELYDHDEAGYTNGSLIRALFLPECILTEEEIFDGDNYIWSWKSWLNEVVIFQKLPKNEPILLGKDKIRTEMLPEKEEIPFLFPNTEISAENLQIFGKKETLLLFADENEKGNLMYCYWDEDIYRRIVRNEGEDYTSIYFQQNEDFAVYAELFENRVTMRFRNLSTEVWHEVTPETIPEAYAFFSGQWQIFQQQFSDIVFYRRKYNALVTPEKLREILALPLVKDRYSDYYNGDGDMRYWGDYGWRFRQESDEHSPRIQITLHEYQEGEQLVTFFHFQLDEPADRMVKLYTQDGNGYGFDVYEAEANQTEFYARAIKAFETLERHIFRLNDNYLRDNKRSK